ncbi:MAG TPA: YjbH domain-containing protein [Burkholderiaceae bacterium]|nr:YjbH domain-containing protein [Burkholderiaceae bacterium]
MPEGFPSKSNSFARKSSCFMPCDFVRVLPIVAAIQALAAGCTYAGELPMEAKTLLAQGSTGISVFGASGGLVIPDARLLPDGAVSIAYSNYHDPRFSGASNGENYMFGMGFIPHVEISGRLANYPDNSTFGYVVRDLSANVKFGLPKLFQVQPDLAVGVNDLGGGATFFRSTYAVASQDFGPLRATLGGATGQSTLHGIFGGLQLNLGNGFTALAERNNGASYAGLRFGSDPIASLGNSHLVATVQRSFGARATDGRDFDHTTWGINLIIPFGDNARTVKQAEPATDAIWTPPPGYRAKAVPPVTASSFDGPAIVGQGKAELLAGSTSSMPRAQSLQALQDALQKAGLERVRVGVANSQLVIEYENHRYNRSEVDAIGIALALGTRLAPATVTHIAAVTKKAGLVLYATSVDRQRYQIFMKDGDVYEAREGLEFTLKPNNESGVQWFDEQEGARGYSRIQLEPLLKSFVGTEVGVYDYSLAASARTIVPLWKGAEGVATYVENISDSSNVRNGPFNYASLRSGLKTATLNQSFWITNRLLNTVSVGKYLYNYTGMQDEATFFVPGREDQVRLAYTRLKYSDAFQKTTLVNSGAFYRWNYQPLNLWVEAGYSQYAQKDRGPSVSVSRWFGDIQAQAYIRRSDQATFAGFQLAFPLTPRQGMRPGLTHIEGASQFAYGLETRIASSGECNCITRDVAQEIPIEYSARNFLLNRGRVGKNYLVSQLPRMREAAVLFAPLE